MSEREYRKAARIALIITILLGAFTLPEYQTLAQGGFAHPNGFHSQAQISETKQMVQQNIQPWEDAYNDLTAEADGYLDYSPQAVEDFYAPGYYDDPDASMAAKYLIHGDGFAAYTCALAYQLDESSQRILYADKAEEILNSWATINETVSGVDGDEYMCCGGIGLILAADLLGDYDGWDLADRNNFKDWVSSVFQNSANIMKIRSSDLGCWGTWASISAAHLLDEEENVNADIDLIKDRISWYIAEDGHIPSETNKGSSGIWYTYYALTPLTAACQVAFNATGVDLFNYTSPNSRSIKLALDFFIYYLENPEEWPFYDGDDLITLSPHSSAGQLYMAMASIYEDDDYENWVTSLGPVSDSTWWDNVHIAWKFPVIMQPLPARHTWESYGDTEHTTHCDDFDEYPSENIIYMHGTGFGDTVDYRVCFWDGSGQLRGPVDTSSDSIGNLSAAHALTQGTDIEGNWRCSVYDDQTYTPISYNSDDPKMVADDTSFGDGYAFYVSATAIPELPTVFAMIVIMGLCAGIYLWIRKRRITSVKA